MTFDHTFPAYDLLCKFSTQLFVEEDEKSKLSCVRLGLWADAKPRPPSRLETFVQRIVNF
jgi:hypothetical protein